MKKEFQHPVCIGLITKNAKSKSALNFKKRISKDLPKNEIVMLLLETPEKRLSAVKKCMILMDIACAFVSSEYANKIIKHVDKLDASAKEARKANVVTLQKNKLVASFAKELF